METCALRAEVALPGESRQWGRRSQMLAAVVIVAVLALMVAGRHPSVLDALHQRAATPAAVNEPQAAVSVRPAAGHAGRFEAHGATYRATFDQSGFNYLASQ